MPTNRPAKAMLNTTINKEVLDNFREYCQQINFPMNTVLETFMRQFAAGQFDVRLSRSHTELDLNE